jgi:hypothetical protein
MYNMQEENVINWITVSRLNVVNWFTVSPAGVSVPVWPRGIPSPRHTPGLKGEITNIILDISKPLLLPCKCTKPLFEHEYCWIGGQVLSQANLTVCRLSQPLTNIHRRLAWHAM